MVHGWDWYVLFCLGHRIITTRMAYACDCVGTGSVSLLFAQSVPVVITIRLSKHIMPRDTMPYGLANQNSNNATYL